MTDLLDVKLSDDELLGEIAMVGDLMVAAAGAEERLDQRLVDRILGLAPARDPKLPSQGLFGRPA